MGVRGSKPPVSPCSERPARGLVAHGAGGAAAAVTGNKFPKRLRVRTNKEFRQAYEQDCAAHGRWMVVFRREGAGAGFRLGVVASRKVGGSPERARAKRRLREAYRLNRRLFEAEQGDVIVVARRGAVKASWPKLVAEFVQLARKAGFRAAGEAGAADGGQGVGAGVAGGAE